MQEFRCFGCGKITMSNYPPAECGCGNNLQKTISDEEEIPEWRRKLEEQMEQEDRLVRDVPLL